MINNSRLFFDLNNKKLRRARRLYSFICAPTIKDKGDYAIVCAYRAKESGLYAVSTGLGDVTFAMERACFKRFGDKSVDRRWNYDWSNWCASRREGEEFWSIWEKAKYIARKYSRFGKVKIRLKL